MIGDIPRSGSARPFTAFATRRSVPPQEASGFVVRFVRPVTIFVAGVLLRRRVAAPAVTAVSGGALSRGAGVLTMRPAPLRSFVVLPTAVGTQPQTATAGLPVESLTLARRALIPATAGCTVLSPMGEGVWRRIPVQRPRSRSSVKAPAVRGTKSAVVAITSVVFRTSSNPASCRGVTVAWRQTSTTARGVSMQKSA